MHSAANGFTKFLSKYSKSTEKIYHKLLIKNGVDRDEASVVAKLASLEVLTPVVVATAHSISSDVVDLMLDELKRAWSEVAAFKFINSLKSFAVHDGTRVEEGDDFVKVKLSPVHAGLCRVGVSQQMVALLTNAAVHSVLGMFLGEADGLLREYAKIVEKLYGKVYDEGWKALEELLPSLMAAKTPFELQATAAEFELIDKARAAYVLAPYILLDCTVKCIVPTLFFRRDGRNASPVHLVSFGVDDGKYDPQLLSELVMLWLKDTKRTVFDVLRDNPDGVIPAALHKHQKCKVVSYGCMWDGGTRWCLYRFPHEMDWVEITEDDYRAIVLFRGYQVATSLSLELNAAVREGVDKDLNMNELLDMTLTEYLVRGFEVMRLLEPEITLAQVKVYGKEIDFEPSQCSPLGTGEIHIPWRENTVLNTKVFDELDSKAAKVLSRGSQDAELGNKLLSAKKRFERQTGLEVLIGFGVRVGGILPDPLHVFITNDEMGNVYWKIAEMTNRGCGMSELDKTFLKLPVHIVGVYQNDMSDVRELEKPLKVNITVSAGELVRLAMPIKHYGETPIGHALFGENIVSSKAIKVAIATALLDMVAQKPELLDKLCWNSGAKTDNVQVGKDRSGRVNKKRNPQATSPSG